MNSFLIKNVRIINEGHDFRSDVLLKDGIIEKIAPSISASGVTEILAEHLVLMPGLIDDQVHFREPGLTHKGDIYTESRAAVAGGTTSFMEMPNTVPNTFTQALLADKYQIAAAKSPANYSFFMGASNDNMEEVLRTDGSKVCGIKVFMGSSTGNMLVDNPKTLETIFSQSPLLIATHCEDEATVKARVAQFKEQYGDQVPANIHPLIRNEEACYLSSSMAVELAKKFNTRLHILHISTAKETHLFERKPLEKKRITAEACVHHLWFDDSYYAQLGNSIKWNPAVKSAADRDEILKAVLDGRIDVIATDHAPHTIEEKSKHYWEAPSGGPLVQHSLVALLELYHQGKISLTQIAEKAAHHPAIAFKLQNRGYIREGYAADLVLVDLNKAQTVSKANVLYKCGWSPFEGTTFQSSVHSTFVNGHLAYNQGRIDDSIKGQRLLFSKER